MSKMRRWSLAVGLGMALTVSIPATAVAAPPAEAAAEVVTTRVQKDTPDNMCLTASGGVGSQAYQDPCGTGEAQYWEFVGPYYAAQGGLYYLMRNRATGLCLEEMAGSETGSPVVQQTCDTAEPPRNSQAWGMTSGDFQMIGSRTSELQIRLPGSTPGAGAVYSAFVEPHDELAYKFLDEAPEW